MHDHWIADRMRSIEASGVRKIFELARSLRDPVNLSIGQPHFDVPAGVKDAAISAIAAGRNGYTVTQGIPELLDRVRSEVRTRLNDPNREALVTSGTSGALMLALLATVNPGDEVILFDPYFVSYPHLVTIAGGRAVILDTYPDFTIDVNQVAAAFTPRTKAVLFSSPANPTGVTVPAETLRDLANLCRERGVLLISDEIYRAFWYDGPFRSAAEFDSNVLVVDGFGKSYGMTGWRVGYAHGPRRIIEEMAKLQQFTFVCAPAPFQAAAVAALAADIGPIVADYRRKRDFMVQQLRRRYELVSPGGAFYCYPKVPVAESATAFVTRALAKNLLVIPGSAFSRRDTHVRVSFAASDAVLERGLDILDELAR